jgi:hypothetical protein
MDAEEEYIIIYAAEQDNSAKGSASTQREPNISFDDLSQVNYNNLLTNELRAVLATRMRFYQDKELNVTAELAQAAEHHNDDELYIASKILVASYKEQENFHELLVAWRGFPVREATWEPYSVMAVDVPEMMAKFVESQDDTDMVHKVRVFESSHGEELCITKDENSVNIKCRGISCNFLRESRI